MAETGIYEFTAELQPDQRYRLDVTGLTGDAAALRYTVSTDPHSEPPPVSLSSPLFSRYVGPVGESTRTVEYPTYAHFRFLLTTDGAPLPDFHVTVTGEDGIGLLGRPL